MIKYLVTPIFIAALLVAAPAAGQRAIERNDPPSPGVRPAEPLSGEAETLESDDERPLGVNIARIVLIGPGASVEDAGRDGPPVDPSGAAGIAPEPFITALSPQIGAPLTLALISEIQASIARVYREAGYPFVSVTTPPQEISGGVLRLRVIEFRADKILTEGDAADPGLAGAIRTKPGERINSRDLEEDLDWLNRSGGRAVRAQFSAGEEAGASDLTIVADELDPAFYLGWSNASAGDFEESNRFFAGVNFAIPALNYLSVAWQTTAGIKGWDDISDIAPGNGDHPNYLSHSAEIRLPTWPRQALTASPSVVFSSSPIAPGIKSESRVLETPVEYRSAISNIIPGWNVGDIYGGVAFKRQWRRIYAGDTLAAKGKSDLIQGYLGWAHDFDSVLGSTDIDIGLTVNPGGIFSRNDDSHWSEFSGGTITDATWVYGVAGVTHDAPLPGGGGLRVQMNGILSDQALPDTERLGLGGYDAVRGYSLNEGTVDSGGFTRIELRAPAQKFLGYTGEVDDAFVPFAHFDAGFGRDKINNESESLISTGVGAYYQLDAFSAGMSLSVALDDELETESGDVEFKMRAMIRF